MNAREFLESIKDTVTMINTYQQQLLRIRLIAYGAPISTYGEIVGGRAVGQKTSAQEQYVIKVEVCEEHIKSVTERYAEALNTAISLIEMLPTIKMRIAITSYYLNNLPEKVCAINMNVCERQFQNIKSAAISEFEKIYNSTSAPQAQIG